MSPNAALVSVGTELTRGIIRDSHGQMISRSLTNLGYHVAQMVILPDDGTIASVLHAIARKNDVVIVTGGLGPTADDMTRDTIADVAGVPLERNQECWDALHARIGERLRGANERQTLLPKGFSRIPNANGTADGFWGRSSGGSLLICLPGPPRELTPMFSEYVEPLLAKEAGRAVEARREYTSFITAEARLEDLAEQIAPNLTWATRFQDTKISLYLSGGTDEEKDEAIAKLRAHCGSALIADGGTSAPEILREALHERKAAFSCAESCTGGLAASYATDLAGSSEWFNGGVVSYSNEAKEKVLGVSPETIAAHGAVSEETAREMAEGVLSKIPSDYSFSITGVAGPAESERKKAGTVCFGFAGKGRKTQALTIRFTSWGRASVRRKSAVAAFILLSLYIRGEENLALVASGWAEA